MGLSARRIRSSQTMAEDAFGTASSVSGKGIIKNIGVWSSYGEGGFELVIDGELGTQGQAQICVVIT